MATSKGKSNVKHSNTVKTVKGAEAPTNLKKEMKAPSKSKVTKGDTKPKTQKTVSKPASKPKTDNKAKPKTVNKVKPKTVSKTKKTTTVKGKSSSKLLDFSYSVVTPDQARELCRRDAKLMATDEQAYVESNTCQYYLLVNTWLLLAGELCNAEAQSEILFSIKRDGVIETIRHASEMLDNVRGRMRGDEIPSYTPFPSIAFCEDVRIISEVLAFPKRFSPLKADVRNAKAIKNFYDVNRRCRDYGRSNGSKWIEDLLSEKLAILLNGFTKAYKKYSECVYFSSGVCADAKTPQEKVLAYVAGNPDHEIYGIRYKCEDYKWGTPNAILRMPYNFNGVEHDWTQPVFICKPTCVPKSYKAPRIICPEPTYAASKKQGILRAIRDCLDKAPKGMQIFDDSDQATNQMLAFMGSRDGDYATIDKSSASDSISASLMARILPNDVWKAIWPYYISWFQLDDGRLVHKDMFASSGDPICFILEGCLFSALEMVAEDLVDTFAGKPVKKGKAYTGRVFGDDIITKVDYFQTYCELAEKLGFVINMDKSYHAGPFRESCGADFYYGMNVSARYWPRKEININKVECVVSIIELQHRLYDVIKCRLFLTEFILARFPDMTFSEPGSACDDLWGSIPEVPTVSCPVSGKVVDEEYALREVHYSIGATSPKGDSELLQIYHYYKFLHDGPQFDDKLSELLKVSSPISRIGECAKPALTFKRKRKS